MGTVFKKTVTKEKPEGAEVLTLKGELWVRWKNAKGKLCKAKLTTGELGQERIVFESRTYYAKFRDGGGIVRTVATGCRDEAAARSVLGDLERRAELVKAGVMTASEDEIAGQQSVPLADHAAAFLASLRSKGVTTVYRENVRRALDRLAKDCGFVRLSDLRREALESWLVGRIGDGMSARSRNAYQEAIIAFSNWCVTSKRLNVNPFKAIPKANENADHRRQRRSMTEAELVRLLDAARNRPRLEAQTVRRGKRKGQTVANLQADTVAKLERIGRERALIYKTKVLTGLRKGELASLTMRHLDLDGPIPCATLDAGDEKNREGNTLPLRDDLAADLRAWLADKLAILQSEAREQGEPIPARLPTDTPLFDVPVGLLRIFNRDLEAAGIAKRDERGRTLDVHALRTTFGTLLSKGGVAPRTAQAAMRHSDIRLTMGVYTDPKLLDVRGALDSLPMLPLDAGQSDVAAAARATGTDNIAPRQFAPRFAPTLDKRVQIWPNVDKSAEADERAGESLRIVATSSPVNAKGPLTGIVNEPSHIGVTGFEPATSWSRTKKYSISSMFFEATGARYP
jgi:integrase